MTLSIRSYFEERRSRRALREWEQSGRPVPPPHIFKQQTIREFATRFRTRVFVETGTYQGDMIEAMRDQFRHLYSIELGMDLWRKAHDRFSRFKHICVRQGDSGVVLNEILAGINEPCLFWLDGHYSEGVTAKGVLNTPIVRELQAIVNHPVQEHVVLIDDARCFVGRDDYPAIPDLQRNVAAARPHWLMSVDDDIIRFHHRL